MTASTAALRAPQRQAILTVDLGFGDAGKGSIVDFLTREHAAHTVVRYNGGAQAGHRVVDSGQPGREHVFSQFGSGTLAGAATHLSRFMLLDPLAMLVEAEHLHELGCHAVMARTTIDAGALVTTPFQAAANRLKEIARGAGRHGSCGMGIGETAADALAHGARVLRAGDLADAATTVRKLRFLQRLNRAKVAALGGALPETATVAAEMALLEDPAALDWLMARYADFTRQAQIVGGAYLHALLRRPGAVIFEGAQGVLLDEAVGFHPHTTWSNITPGNALRLLAEAGYTDPVTRVGITRAYATRHGAGPFVSEEPALATALPDPANHFGAWQEGFRVGWLDLVLLRYAAAVTGALDYVAVTCLDRLAALPVRQVCTAYANGRERVERLAPAATVGDLVHQADLTRLLGACRPVLAPVADQAELLRLIEAATGAPAALLSYGASAHEKRWATCIPTAARVPAHTG